MPSRYRADNQLACLVIIIIIIAATNTTYDAAS